MLSEFEFSTQTEKKMYLHLSQDYPFLCHRFRRTFSPPHLQPGHSRKIMLLSHAQLSDENLSFFRLFLSCSTQ